MNERLKPSFEEKIVYSLAKVLLATHKKQIALIEDYFAEKGHEDVFSPLSWFDYVLNKYCRDEDLARFVAHGITKGEEDIKLHALLSILLTGHIRGSWAKIRNSGYINAYTNGSFTLISPIDEQLVTDRRLNIGAVVVAPHLVPLIPILKRFFSKIKFMEVSDFPAWVEEQKR